MSDDGQLFFWFIIIYGILLFIVFKIDYYRNATDYFSTECLQMAKKLGKPIVYCDTCRKIIIDPKTNQKRHAHCTAYGFVKSVKVKAKKFSDYKVSKLKNGVEIVENIIGMEIKK